ncbi:MAG: hypothetical protein IT328_23790 [Caldilineaceae bacterium]|nr:hypothetical protein [Caldilineaceae bacterium]
MYLRFRTCREALHDENFCKVAKQYPCRDTLVRSRLLADFEETLFWEERAFSKRTIPMSQHFLRSHPRPSIQMLRTWPEREVHDDEIAIVPEHTGAAARSHSSKEQQP